MKSPIALVRTLFICLCFTAMSIAVANAGGNDDSGGGGHGGGGPKSNRLVMKTKN